MNFLKFFCVTLFCVLSPVYVLKNSYHLATLTTQSRYHWNVLFFLFRIVHFFILLCIPFSHSMWDVDLFFRALLVLLCSLVFVQEDPPRLGAWLYAGWLDSCLVVLLESSHILLHGRLYWRLNALFAWGSGEGVRIMDELQFLSCDEAMEWGANFLCLGVHSSWPTVQVQWVSNLALPVKLASLEKRTQAWIFLEGPRWFHHVALLAHLWLWCGCEQIPSRGCCTRASWPADCLHRFTRIMAPCAVVQQGWKWG